MGQEILYCFKCQERVTSADLDSANALRFGNRTACRKCVPDLLAGLSPEERKDLVARVQSPKRAPTARAVAPPVPRPKVQEKQRPARANPVVLGAIGGIVAALTVAIVLMAGGSAPAPRPEEAPREDPAALKRKALAKEFSAVEERARVALQKEEFGSALAIYESARAVHPDPEWIGLVDAKIAEVRKSVDALYGPLKAQAAAAKAKGAENDVKSVRDRVERWGLAGKATELEAHLRNLAPPAPPAARPTPPPTPAPGARPWTSIWDGKSVDFLVLGGEGAWVPENGSLVHVKEKKASAQTIRQFTDGEFRIRFKFRDVSHIGFAIRQSMEGSLGVGLDRLVLETLDDKEHELLISFKGAEATATLNGKPQPIQVNGKSMKGALQFNAYGEYFVIKTLEFRETAAEIPSLVGHWTFEAAPSGNSDDSSGLANDSKLLEGAVLGPGRIGNAVHFDGRKANVSVPSSPSLVLTGPLTIAAWVNPGPRRENYAPSIVEKWDTVRGGGQSGYFLRLAKTGQVHFVVSEPAGMAEVFSVTSPPSNAWTLLTAVFEKGSVKIYVNGTLEKTAPANVSPGISRSALRIGMGGGEGGHYFQGALDEVRLYKRALAAEEIARMAGDSTIPGLVGYWKLDEAGGAVAADSSGTGLRGTLVNGPAWVPGKHGHALSFNGENAVLNIESGAPLMDLQKSGMTACAWFLARGPKRGQILDTSNANVGWILAWKPENKIEFLADHFRTSEVKLLTSGTFAANVWHHVAATWDGSPSASRARLYVNGLPADVKGVDGVGELREDVPSPLSVGNRRRQDRGFDGLIDEVRVYNRVLSASEILGLFNGTAK
jgi:uncharacterized protein YodC (DUF2158 family)